MNHVEFLAGHGLETTSEISQAFAHVEEATVRAAELDGDAFAARTASDLQAARVSDAQAEVDVLTNGLAKHKAALADGGSLKSFTAGRERLDQATAMLEALQAVASEATSLAESIASAAARRHESVKALTKEAWQAVVTRMLVVREAHIKEADKLLAASDKLFVEHCGPYWIPSQLCMIPPKDKFTSILDYDWRGRQGRKPFNPLGEHVQAVHPDKNFESAPYHRPPYAS